MQQRLLTSEDGISKYNSPDILHMMAFVPCGELSKRAIRGTPRYSYELTHISRENGFDVLPIVCHDNPPV